MLITISRQYGAGGSEVARRVAAALDWRVVDNELIEQVAARAGLPPERVAQREERVPTFVERLARSLAVATPEVFPPPDSAGAIIDMPEADLVKVTEVVVAEIAAQGRVVLVGRAAPAVLARERDAL
ncbi:MAG TPA: cytidylate kinase family protein, partial [Myxococcota bacterium]|nr:cytidylate kinase family protein [Myxococcota bacterium]